MNTNDILDDEIIFKRYFPVQHSLKKKNGYDFLISNDESIIYKKNNFSNPQLLDLINTPEKLENFSRILDGRVFAPEIQEHISKGHDLEANGSYKSEFLHGYRLDLLGSYTLDSVVYSSVLDQCQVLVSRLVQLDAKKELTGDWALHNLVYSLKYKRIINVDLEGFLFYDPLPEWANIRFIQEWFDSITRES
tara:strand:- start:7614 stop:8189 length:576 start_codon:yes stop_codon:yes gene_type:complete